MLRAEWWSGNSSTRPGFLWCSFMNSNARVTYRASRLLRTIPHSPLGLCEILLAAAYDGALWNRRQRASRTFTLAADPDLHRCILRENHFLSPSNEMCIH